MWSAETQTWCILEKIATVISRLATWGIALNYSIEIWCDFQCGGVSQVIPLMHRGTPLGMKLFRISAGAHTEISKTLGLLRIGSVHDFKTVSFSFLVTFVMNFDAIFWNDSIFSHTF